MAPKSANSLAVLTVPAFNDNYVWLIHDGTHAVAVDPGEAAPVQNALKDNQLSLSAIVLTHRHDDHVAGVAALLEDKQIPVYGPRNEKVAIPTVTEPVAEGDTIAVPEMNLELTVLDVPGHTVGHVAYVEPNNNWLFPGDTLFAGGCGRLFEGTPKEMAKSLSKLTALPDDTLVYCGHEYTISNLKFAIEVEPHNKALAERMQDAEALRKKGQPTIPSTMALEKATNPFLRYAEPEIMTRLIANGRLGKKADAVASFTAVREWKNNF